MKNLEQKSETTKIFYDKLLEELNLKKAEKNYSGTHIKYSLRIITPRYVNLF
jgi:hypothetical protein